MEAGHESINGRFSLPFYCFLFSIVVTPVSQPISISSRYLLSQIKNPIYYTTYSDCKTGGSCATHFNKTKITNQMDFNFGPGFGGGCGDPRCTSCSAGGGMGGFMSPPQFTPCGPGCTGDCQRGGGGGFPGMMSPGGGGFTGMGSPPPSMGWPGMKSDASKGTDGGGGLTSSQAPYIYPLGATGQKIDMIIDTGASLTIITPAAFNKHFPGFPVTTNKNINVGGVGGGSTPSNQRFTMPLVFDINGRQVKVEGECWILSTPVAVECLLGLPFLRSNRMTLDWAGDGDPDSITVQGEKVPIKVEVSAFYQVARPSKRVHGGQNQGHNVGHMFRLGGKQKQGQSLGNMFRLGGKKKQEQSLGNLFGLGGKQKQKQEESAGRQFRFGGKQKQARK